MNARRNVVVLLASLLAASAVACTGPRHADDASARAAESLDTDPPPGADGTRLQRAVHAVDQGSLSDAIAALEELHEKYSDNALVLHELALAYRLAKRPAEAVELLMPYEARLPAETLAALGSSLDEAGDRQQAIRVLREGLERYPRSGLVHAELATTLASAGEIEEALTLYVQGTEVEPSLAINYGHLASILAHSDQRGLALVFGEMFRVLEPGTARSAAMANVMFDVCRDSVTIEGKGKKKQVRVALAPAIVIERPEQLEELPLVNVFELTFGPGLGKAHLDGLSLATLHEARVAFVQTMNKPDSPIAWNAVPLFRWLREVDAAGHLKAYDYWLFGPALPDEHARWAKEHRKALDRMAEWLKAHPVFERNAR